jgi:hypothetical protein
MVLVHDTVPAEFWSGTEPNLLSGRKSSDIELGEFTREARRRPEHQELIRLIGH